MFKVKLSAPRYKLKNGWTENVHERVRVQLRQAAREFVATAIQDIPLDTGQARGTFLPLARFLNASVPTSGGNPTSSKNPSTGAGDENKLIFKFTTMATGETFEINPQLLYFIVNDIFGHPSGKHAPWKSIEHGWKAFMKYIKDVAPQRYPKIGQYITFDIVEYG